MSDYNDEPEFDSFLPITLIALSLCIVLGWQIFNALQTRKSWQAQYEQRKTLVEQSAKVQGGLEAMVNDLLALAEVDKEAKAVVDKYQIRRNEPAAK
jgi:hypothetical protein